MGSGEIYFLSDYVSLVSKTQRKKNKLKKIATAGDGKKMKALTLN